LATKSDFNLFDAFNIFDQGRIGQISIHEIKDGLNKIGVYPTGEELELFMTRYDRGGDRRLTFAEFGDAFLPMDSHCSTILNRRKANPLVKAMYRIDDCFLADTQVEFRSMWRTHFKIEGSSETLRQRLNSRPLFNVYEAFNSLDINSNGRVTVDEINRMIESRGYFVDRKDIASVIKKCDRNGDGSVNYNEFREEIMPKSPMRRC
jgi:Ca2+-binding EF-hand superfamily protein